MLRWISILALSFMYASMSFAQQGHSPYEGQEKRVIKALSVQELNDYKKGSGMGMAKAAELNHYPGPKHILELADKLTLSDEQKDRIRAAYDAMHTEAVSIGMMIIKQEELLDRLFAHSLIDETQLDNITGEIGRLKGQLRAVHLKAHLVAKNILTEKQIDAYDALRGYGQDSSDEAGREHNHGHH